MCQTVQGDLNEEQLEILAAYFTNPESLKLIEPELAPEAAA